MAKADQKTFLWKYLLWQFISLGGGKESFWLKKTGFF
jgi:hypothetical protein